MQHILDEEKFDKVKELAEIYNNISIARETLSSLKENTDEYMKVREEEAEQRVIKVLKESRDALDEITNNHKELSTFGYELKAFANELRIISTDIASLFQDFNTRAREAEKDMEEHQKNVDAIRQDIKIQRVKLTEDRKLVDADRKWVEKEKFILKDRIAALDRSWEELKKLKDNK